MATSDNTQKNDTTQTRRRALSGIVVSDKMRDTVVVAVTRYVKHPRYHKYVKRIKRYSAHDAGNTRAVGERVRIEECRPVSKNKHFVVIQGTK